MEAVNYINEEFKREEEPGQGRIKKLQRVFDTYRAAKVNTDSRIKAANNWWRLRYGIGEKTALQYGEDGFGFESRSAWLHNTIANKHADAMDSAPEPIIRARRDTDVQEAEKLEKIIPFILEHNGFEEVYSAIQWSKLTVGTGVYKVFWDSTMLNGLGDIRVLSVNPLNLYWTPGINDIQDSLYVFSIEDVEREVLEGQYPQLKNKAIVVSDETQSHGQSEETHPEKTTLMVTECYYKKWNGMKTVLHYIKYVGDTVLYSSEDMQNAPTNAMGQPAGAPMAQTGLYEHGLYPYVFDTLYPVPGSPGGYGHVDTGANPQARIDLMNTSLTKAMIVGSEPRFLKRIDGNINEKQFLDWSSPFVDVEGNIDEASIKQIQVNTVSGNSISILDHAVNELRETSGNTETASGNTTNGVTAASAIAALQEASGKGSRDATRTSYRAFQKVVELCIELIRQFYDLPRYFRIMGANGQDEFVAYDNSGIQLQPQFDAAGQQLGFRKPVFDVKITVQKGNAYSRMAQNELALQFYNLGFFNPAQAEPALMCLDMMDFDGKTKVIDKIAQQAQMFNKLQQYMQIAASLSGGDPDLMAMIQMDQAQFGGAPMPQQGAAPNMPQGEADSNPANSSHMQKARARARNASQPGG